MRPTLTAPVLAGPVLAALCLAAATCGTQADAGHLFHRTGYGYGGYAAAPFRLDYSPYRYSGFSSFHGPAYYTPASYSPAAYSPALNTLATHYRAGGYGYGYRSYGYRGFGYGGLYGPAYRSPYYRSYAGAYGYRSAAYPGMWYGYNRLSPYGLGYGSYGLGYGGLGYGGLGYGGYGYASGFGSTYIPVTTGYNYSAGYLNPHCSSAFARIPVYTPVIASASPCVYGAYGYGY